jgi:hypothetical protein
VVRKGIAGIAKRWDTFDHFTSLKNA